MSIEDVAAALLKALPKCEKCARPATRGGSGGAPLRCDGHAIYIAMEPSLSMKGFVEYDRLATPMRMAPEIRALEDAYTAGPGECRQDLLDILEARYV